MGASDGGASSDWSRFSFKLTDLCDCRASIEEEESPPTDHFERFHLHFYVYA